eukprot:2362090-Pleurochrysis_carterae.AAC.1
MARFSAAWKWGFQSDIQAALSPPSLIGSPCGTPGCREAMLLRCQPSWAPGGARERATVKTTPKSQIPTSVL